MISHLESMIFGALIVFFLIVEPHGLARLWAIAQARSCGCGRSRIDGGDARLAPNQPEETNMPKLLISGLFVALGMVVATAGTALAQNEQFIPSLVYRSGAYAPNGIPFANGVADYLKLVNERDGGINGVKITTEECETGYATDRGVECYERLKGKGPTGASLFMPLSTGITYALMEKVPATRSRCSTAATAGPKAPTATSFPGPSRSSAPIGTPATSRSNTSPSRWAAGTS